MRISDGMVVPVNERCARLKEIVFGYVDVLANIRQKTPNLFPQRPVTLLLLSYPWLADDIAAPPEQRGILEQNKGLFTALGFNGAQLKANIKEILAQDRHLAECCPTPIHLVNYLDVSLITPSAVAKLSGLPQNRLDAAFDDFEMSTYHQGRFKRILLTHLFNFDMSSDSCTIGDLRIERIGPETIPRLLGESGFQAFLHPNGIGNCFVVEEEGATAVADAEWMLEKRNKAIRFGELLQFYKDGVVYAGYSAIHFSPEWVNQVRKWGLFFLGSPRQLPYEGGAKPYLMTDTDKSRLSDWWSLMRSPEIAKALDNKTGKLRAATWRAAEYYEASHERPSQAERLIALAIALESLFSPGDNSELSFRISQSAAQLIGENSAERTRIFESLREMYRKRSKLFHGSYDLNEYQEGRFVTSGKIDEWSSYIRRSYLAFITLYLRGESSRDAILEQLAEASLDDRKGEELRKRANIEHLISELTSRNAGATMPGQGVNA